MARSPKRSFYMKRPRRRDFPHRPRRDQRSADGMITEDEVEVRQGALRPWPRGTKSTYIDVASNQAFSVATSLIPFLNHDDANRALNGNRTCISKPPLASSGSAICGDSMEHKAVLDTAVSSSLRKTARSSLSTPRRSSFTARSRQEARIRARPFPAHQRFTAFHQRPIVSVGDKVKKGDTLADTSRQRTDRSPSAITPWSPSCPGPAITTRTLSSFRSVSSRIPSELYHMRNSW